MDIRDVIVVLDFGRIELCFGAMHQGRIYIRAPYVLGIQPSVNRSCNPLAKRLPYARGRVITRVYFQFSPPFSFFLSAWTASLLVGSKTFRSYTPRDNEIGERDPLPSIIVVSSFTFLFPFSFPPPSFQKRNDSENGAIRKHGS